MGQRRYTVSRGTSKERDVSSETDATSFSGTIRLIIKDDAPKSEIYSLIDLLKNKFLSETYPF